jgi:hypothetical protein
MDNGTIYSRHAHWYYQHVSRVICQMFVFLVYREACSVGHGTERGSQQTRQLLRGSDVDQSCGPISSGIGLVVVNMVSAFLLHVHPLLPKAVAAIIVVIGYNRVFQEKVIPTNPLTESSVVFVGFALLIVIMMWEEIMRIEDGEDRL